ncbi:MAG: hypothetical protein AMXMBFR13_15540 [Phycisphaerae bacterium]
MKRAGAPLSALLVIAAAAPASLAAVSVDTLLDDMVTLRRLTKIPDPAYTTKQFSSYDRGSKSFSEYVGWFANADAGHYLRVEDKDGRKEHVMMDAKGPGAVVRIWSANPKGKLRFYLDGADEPVIEGDMTQILGGKYPGLPTPIAGERAKGWNLYFPVPYAKSCKVTSDEGGFYYHVNYRTYAEGTQVKTFVANDLKRLSSRIQDIARRLADPRAGGDPPADRKKTPFDVNLADGAQGTLWEMDGPKAVCGFLVHLEADDLARAARGIVLRMDFDGNHTVETPIGDFFGTAPGLIPYASFPLGITEPQDGKPQDMWCHWYMPFGKSAKILVENMSGIKVRVHGAVAAVAYDWDDQSLLFNARWRIERDVPTRPFSDWQHLQANGNGRFVGGHLHIVNNVRDWWGEGDEKIYVDGETFPSHLGTGTEDYYGYAWCSPERFVHAYHNQPHCQGPNNYGNTSINRFHVLDDIPFTKSFRFDVENWHWHERARTTRAAISYWYARPKSTSFFGPIIRSDVELKPVPEYQVFRVPGAIEGEKMAVLTRAGNVGTQHLGSIWSGEEQLFWTQAKPGDRIMVGFESPEAGRKQVLARFTKAADYAKVQIYINGQKAGDPIDLYNHGVTPTNEMDLGAFELKKGQNTLAIEITGANNKAEKKYLVGLDYILLK